MPSRFTVLVPAHDEERTIARLLRGLRPPPGRPDAMAVIVVCNACRDATARAAQAAWPEALVIERAEPGKAGAINAGLAVARDWPVIVVDADIQVDFRALEAVAACLSAGDAAIAAPALRVDCGHSSRWVRAYYRVWLGQPYAMQDCVGSGIYGLSRRAGQAVAPLPPVIADDAFVRGRFARADRRAVASGTDGAPVWFTVTAPADLRSLLRIEARRRAGDAELRAMGALPRADGRTTLASLRQAPAASPADRAVYAAIKLAGRALYLWNRLRGRHRIWWRDESSR